MYLYCSLCKCKSKVLALFCNLPYKLGSDIDTRGDKVSNHSALNASLALEITNTPIGPKVYGKLAWAINNYPGSGYVLQVLLGFHLSGLISNLSSF